MDKRSGGRGQAAWATALSLATILAATPVWAARTNPQSTSAYERGFQRFERGDVRGARIELLKALQADPDNELARLLQARVMLALGNGVAAQTELEKAVQAGVPRDKTRHLMAHALVLQRQFDRAIREADPALVPPQFASYAARMRGRAQLALSQPDRARAEFEQAMELAPKSAEALADMALFNRMHGRAPEGEKLVDRALTLEPTNVSALVAKADFVRRRLGPQQAMAYYNQALQVDPNHVEALLERASTLADLKRVDEARADLRKLQTLAPDNPLGLYVEAMIEARAGRYAQANALMTRTRGVLNRYPPALLLQGMIAYQLGELQQADEYLSKVVAQAPDNQLARTIYAAVQLRKNDPNGAIETLRPVVTGDKPTARVLALMGTAYARRGQFDVAQQYLERAARVAPGQETVRTQLAMTRAAQGNTAGAAADIAAVLKEDPNSLQALMLSTVVNMRQGKLREAVAVTNRIVKAHPDSPLGYNLRGAALMALNDRKGAEANFRAAIAKKPDFIEARRNLGQLLIATGRTGAGQQELLRVIEIKGNDARSMTMLAAVAASQGKTTDQINWLRRAASAQPSLLEPRVALMRSYLSIGQPNRALTEARAIERDFAGNPRALESLGVTYLVTRRPQDAENAFSRLVKERPSAVGPRVLLARAQQAQNRTDTARQTLNQALALKNQNLLPAYIDLVGLEMRAKRYPEALAVAERVRRAYPRLNAADQLIGDVRMRTGQVPQAIAAYQAARRVKFTESVASRLAHAYMQARQPAQAIATMTAYRQANPRDRRAAAQLADIYLQTGQYRPAVAIYENMRKQGVGDDPVVLNNLAWASHRLGDKRAAGFAEAALKRAPRSPAIQDTLGQILVETRRDPKRGLALLQSAVKASPRDGEMRFHLAKAYQANGRQADAVRELQTALKSPQFASAPQARRLLAQLKS